MFRMNAPLPSPPLAGFPLADPTRTSLGVSPEAIERWCRWFVILGLVARCVRYFAHFPLWEDESFVCYNYLDRDFAGLTQKLDFPPQVAPTAYLWSQLALVRVFGFNEWALRLTAFLASLGSVVLFARLARELVSGLPRLFAVAVFSVAYMGIRYSAEAKPYGIDLFASLVLTTLTVEWLKNGTTRNLIWLLLAIPLTMAFSFPAVFIAGGSVIFAAATLGRQGTLRMWSGLAVVALTVLASFSGVYFLDIRPRMASDLDSMQGFWNDSFPPIDRPWLIPLWLIRTHASDLTAYPVGGPKFASTGSFLLWLIGIVGVVRWGRGVEQPGCRPLAFVTLLLAPLGLTFIAAALQKYPYGGHAKFNINLAPQMCLAIGYGAALMAEFAARRFPGRHVVGAIGTAFAAVAVSTMSRDLLTPYKSFGDHQYRAFAQWFWTEQELVAEVACVKRDLGVDCCPQMYQQLNYAAVYHCNQAIASPRQRNRRPIAWDKVSTERPLLCALYRDPDLPFDQVALDAWLQSMSADYQLTNRTSLPLYRKNHTGQHIVSRASAEVFQFVPRNSARARLK
jgi:hypothetical protein